MIPRPQTDEYGSFFTGYIQRVPEDADILALLSSQPDELRTLLQNVTDEQTNTRPAPGEWSVKEVIGHINDTERIFAYRASKPSARRRGTGRGSIEPSQSRADGSSPARDGKGYHGRAWSWPAKAG